MSSVSVEVQVSLSPELEEEGGEKVLKLGHVMAGDTISRTLKLHNDSPLGVRFEVQLESLLPQALQKRRPNTFSESRKPHVIVEISQLLLQT